MGELPWARLRISGVRYLFGLVIRRRFVDPRESVPNQDPPRATARHGRYAGAKKHLKARRSLGLGAVRRDPCDLHQRQLQGWQRMVVRCPSRWPVLNLRFFPMRIDALTQLSGVDLPVVDYRLRPLVTVTFAGWLPQERAQGCGGRVVRSHVSFQSRKSCS